MSRVFVNDPADRGSIPGRVILKDSPSSPLHVSSQKRKKTALVVHEEIKRRKERLTASLPSAFFYSRDVETKVIQCNHEESQDTN